MKLYIDTSSNQKTIIKLGDKTLEQDSSVWHSQVVLPMIQKLLRTVNPALPAGRCELKDITEIEVNPGPGSFTGLRVGATIANALGYALKIPVNGKQVDKLDIFEPHYE